MIHIYFANYLIRHKIFVLIECLRLGIPLRGLLHDLSKLLPDEWVPYARYTFGTEASDRSEAARASFEVAVAKHLDRNDHHWEHWLLWGDGSGDGVLARMPDGALRELLADWRATGRMREDVLAWLAKHAGEVAIDEDTERRLARLMTSREWLAWLDARGKLGRPARAPHLFLIRSPSPR